MRNNALCSPIIDRAPGASERPQAASVVLHQYDQEVQVAKYDLKDMPDTSPEEHAAVGKAFCEKLFSNPDVTKKLLATKVIAQFVYWDEDLWGPGVKVYITADCSGDEVEVITGPTDLKPGMVIAESRTTGHVYWMGKLNFMTAVTRGLIKVDGPIRTAMKLVPIIKPGFAVYRETLKEMGYDDLLAFPPD